MAYYKPQSPIKNGEDHIYPLTTYDQIIMPDGTRWNGGTDYTLPAAGSNLGGVKSGGDVSISDGVITVNDNSHTHNVENITDLEDRLSEIENNLTFPVTSVNTKTGDVVLAAADVGALATNGTAANATKFNGKSYADVLKAIYPVGAVYLSTSSTSPASLFGGSWEQLKDRFLLAAGSTYSAGATGGAATHTHGLSESNAFAMLGYASSGVLHLKSVTPAYNWGSTIAKSGLAGTAATTATMSAAALGVGGKTNAASSMPPYLVVYMWKRVS